MKSLLLSLIKIYQITLSPDHGLARIFYPHGFCKYHPTCSQYGYQAIQKYGAIKGALLASKRILRCTPNNAGGIDPVR